MNDRSHTGSVAANAPTPTRTNPSATVMTARTRGTPTLLGVGRFALAADDIEELGGVFDVGQQR